MLFGAERPHQLNAPHTIDSTLDEGTTDIDEMAMIPLQTYSNFFTY